MKEFKTFEEMTIYVINFFSKVFKNSSILKGGMVLKLLGSERFTNDIDYVFIPFRSKKEIKNTIYNELKKEFGNDIKEEIHSACLRYYINNSGMRLQIEISAETACPSIDLSTYELSRKYNQKSSIIRVMRYDAALSHIIAAWNERNLYRDLYDIYFLFSVLGEKPDPDILKKRLSNSKIRNKTVKMTVSDLISKLNIMHSNINIFMINDELGDYLTNDAITGLDKKLKITISKLINFLESID